MELKNKRALVTGGSKRVGRAIALALARKGASILLHYRSSAAEAKTTQAEIKALGVSCELVRADLAKPSEIAAMVKSISGAVDILVNSASAFYKTPLPDATEKEWNDLMDSNLKGPFFWPRSSVNAWPRVREARSSISPIGAVLGLIKTMRCIALLKAVSLH
jgi:NAD(P)-dependent dehydrogenase (short-subunit alcohol dehydrogenase family)